MDNFSITVDYHRKPWSKTEYSRLVFNGEDIIDNIQDDVKNLHWKNANSFHIGFEYSIQKDNMTIPLRLGYYTLPLVGSGGQVRFIDYNNDQIIFDAITVGLGINLDFISLDGSFEYIFGSNQIVIEDGNPVNEDYADYVITFGTTIRFKN